MNILNSRKIRVLIADAVFSLIALTATRFTSPDISDYILSVIAILQLPITAIIAGIAYEDGKALEAGSHPNQRGKVTYE